MPPDPFPDPPPGLDAAVRAALEADAARTDGPALWAAVSARLAADRQPVTPAARPRDRRLLAAAGLVALAAGLLVAVAVGPAGRDVSASPAAAVRQARDAHAGPPDRCYTQSVELPAEARGRFPLLADGGLAARVWTRGDRFVVAPWLGGAWGREPDGRVWFAPSRQAAAGFREEDLPAPVRQAVAVRGLEPRALLDGLLADFDLTWTRPPDPAAAADEVSAVRRGPTPAFGLASADLTLDRATRAVRRLVLRRPLPAGGQVVVAFELTASEDRPDAGYTPAAHLDPDGPVYGADRPVPRRRVLVLGLGHLLKNGL